MFSSANLLSLVRRHSNTHCVLCLPRYWRSYSQLCELGTSNWRSSEEGSAYSISSVLLKQRAGIGIYVFTSVQGREASAALFFFGFSL